MKHNIGKTDRIIRIVAGIAIVGAGMATHSWWAVVGVVPILTGVIRWCPAYLPFGITTDKTA